MQKPFPEEHNEEIKQQTAKAGHDVTIVGHDYQKTTQFNFIIFLAGVLAMGGLAWAIYFGVINKPDVTQQNQVRPEAIQKKAP